MSNEWYFAKGEVKLGPFTWEQLRQLAAAGQILPSDMVWQKEWQTSFPAAQITELFPTTSDPNRMPPVALAPTGKTTDAATPAGTDHATTHTVQESLSPQPYSAFNQPRESHPPGLNSISAFAKFIFPPVKPSLGVAICGPAGMSVVVFWRGEADLLAIFVLSVIGMLAGVVVCLFEAHKQFRSHGASRPNWDTLSPKDWNELISAWVGRGVLLLVIASAPVVASYVGFLLGKAGPEQIGTLIEEARDQVKKGDIDGAVKSYTRAIALVEKSFPNDKRFARAYRDRGALYAVRNAQDEAIADYTAAIRLDSSFAEAYLMRGIAWDKKGEVDKRNADLKEALRLNPELGQKRNGEVLKQK